MNKYGRTSMRLCDLDEIKICVDRQYENCHGYSGSKKAIYREAILAVKSILHSAKSIDGVTAQEWISVKDRLPEEKVNCIVHYRHAYCDDDDYWAIGICFYDGEKFQINPAYKVTHWMPMPNPPKGE